MEELTEGGLNCGSLGNWGDYSEEKCIAGLGDSSKGHRLFSRKQRDGHLSVTGHL
jgi:hypothetical protein